jgi:uncharacterized protein (TIGR03083 family)
MEIDNQPGQDAPQADHIRFLFDPHHTLTALAAQQRRFGSEVATLTDEELASPSRCVGWTVADVLRHLVWVDATMLRLWSGDETPTDGFDPRTTPNEFVRADRIVPNGEIRRRYLSSTEAMALELESADPKRFGHPSLSPAGRVPWWMSAMHLGWDSIVHERDVLIPLGRAMAVEPGETTPTLAYSLVLAALFDRGDRLDVQVGPARLIRSDGPVTVWAVEVASDRNNGSDPHGTRVLTGDPVATADALCGRGTLRESLRGDPTLIDRLSGLARYFASGG